MVNTVHKNIQEQPHSAY
ncbi:hypothetical protein JL09_g5853 [Pichia kudriavzevii]|uniref:Uncharacterized protein n=1 Tax=Pichia kudriavzevii TaxID=4909 RepID=A0A099NQH6_PICKU|nr:hypothetical protein JL09_g5853 [Pichia kudriavzevii]